MVGEMQTNKSWLSRPDGKVGAFLGIVLLAGAGISVLYFWGLILPWLVAMAMNTLTLIGLCAAITAVGVVLFDPRWRNLAFYAYKSLIRAITGAFIELDPIGILRGYVESLMKKLEEMDASIANLDGQRGKLRKQIAQQKRDSDHALELMGEAKKQGKHDAMTLQSRQVDRLNKSNETLSELLGRMDRLALVLGKMRGASDIMIQDIRNEVDLRTKERAALLAGYNAFTKARRIMQGGGDEKEMFDMTMEKLADDYGMKMGEIDSFMNLSKGFLESVDLENGVASTNALAQLEAWENKSSHMLTSMPPPADAQVRIDVTPSLASPTDGFSDLFDAQAPPAKSARRE